VFLCFSFGKEFKVVGADKMQQIQAPYRYLAAPEGLIVQVFIVCCIDEVISLLIIRYFM